MNNDDEKKPDLTDPDAMEIDGVKIQKLPTMGTPLSYKTRKQSGNYTNFQARHAAANKLKRIAKILAEKDKPSEPA